MEAGMEPRSMEPRGMEPRGMEPRSNLIGNRYVIRKGQFIINGDSVSLSMRMSYGNIDCHHVVGHLDNQCFEAEILQKFDNAVGGKATQRGWDYLTFPVWHFSKLRPPSTSTNSDNPAARYVHMRYPSSAMIARTDADCHGNVVDGDQLQSDLDVSPRSAADYHGPISYQLAEALADLDELLGREARFFDKYHSACTTIQADKHVSDDFFFTAQTDAARNLLSSATSSPNRSGKFYFSPPSVYRSLGSEQLVEISELSPRRFKKLMFTASVFVLEKLRQRPLMRFSDLGSDVASMFALGFNFACGLLCRILPPSNVIGVNKCAFAHAREIDAEGKVVLDRELTLKDVFLGENRIYGKVLDSKTIVVRGSELDNICVVLERQETLHVVEVRQKSPTDSMDSAFKVVQDAGQLIVGSSEEVTLLRHMSVLSEQKLKEVASQTSSTQRAIRILCSMCDFPLSKTSTSGQTTRTFYRSVIFPGEKGYLVSSGDRPHLLRTAMVAGMREANDEAKVENVMRSIHAISWTRAIRKAVADIYMRKTRRNADVVGHDVNSDFNSDILVRVSTGSDVEECESHSDAVLFSSIEMVRVAALIRAGIALGMRIERPVGTAVIEGNGRDRMILNVGDDVMNLATQSKFGDGTPVLDDSNENAENESELRKKGFCV